MDIQRISIKNMSYHSFTEADTIPNENWFAKNYFRIVNKISVIE